jgi:hypothetical protein
MRSLNHALPAYGTTMELPLREATAQSRGIMKPRHIATLGGIMATIGALAVILTRGSRRVFLFLIVTALACEAIRLIFVKSE